MTLGFALLIAAVVAPLEPASGAARSRSVAPNPRALEFIERDAAVRAWALARHDANHDGWLTMFEAQAAVEAFRLIADADHDGRLTVPEYENGIAFVRAR